jgi:hypothetical protein
MTAPAPQYGINVRGDRLAPVTQTLDGVDLNVLWDEFRDLLDIWNNERTSLTDLLVFDTTVSAEAVPQNTEVASFEEATELGAPRGAGSPGNGLLVGYRFRDYDLAGRFGWKFLRDADVRQVRSVMDNILSADNKLVSGMIFRRLFSNTRTVNEFGAPVWDFYDGQSPGPPSYLTRTFSDSETHFITTQSSQIDSDTVFDAIRLITRKGYGLHPNSKMLLLTNPDEGELIMQWRQGLESRPKEGSETEGPISVYSFIPALDQPPWITPDGMLVGQQAPGDLWGVKIWGTWGPVSLIQSDFVPPGYAALITTYGPNSPYNPIGFRSHFNPDYQGLRHLPGMGPYPLTESFHQRSFGVGVRHRGACVAIQVATSTTYTPPTDTMIPADR